MQEGGSWGGAMRTEREGRKSRGCQTGGWYSKRWWGETEPEGKRKKLYPEILIHFINSL